LLKVGAKTVGERDPFVPVRPWEEEKGPASESSKGGEWNPANGGGWGPKLIGD